MGCTASKVVAAEVAVDSSSDQVNSVIRPIRRRIDEIRRRRRLGDRRKDSIMSTTELLATEDDNVDLDASYDRSYSITDKSSPSQSSGSIAAPPIEEKEEAAIAAADGEEKEEEEEEEEKEEDGGAEVEVAVTPPETGGTAEERREEDEEGESEGEALFLPGSPSFRIYFVEHKETAECALTGNNGKNTERKDDEAKTEQDSRDKGDSIESLSSIREEPEMKLRNKEKGRRFTALSKAPSRVYGCLNPRNYCHTTVDCSVEHAHDSPRFLSGKAAA